jgi:hypothetical protein
MGFFEFFTVADDFLVSREVTSADDVIDVEEIFLTAKYERWYRACLPACP